MSTIKVDTVRPVTADASLTLQGDSGGSGVTGLTIDSSGVFNTTTAKITNIQATSTQSLTIKDEDGNAAITIGTDNTAAGYLSLNFGSYHGGSGGAGSGTLSGNTLNDFEIGSWTPAFNTTGTGLGSITYDTDPTGVVGKYTKIGDMVAVYFRIRTDAVTIGSATGFLQVTGLPFTTDSDYMGSVGIGYAAGWTNAPKGVYVQLNSTNLYLLERATGNANDTLTAPADMATGADSNQIMCSFVYRTNL